MVALIIESSVESGLKGVRTATSGSSMVGNLVKAAEIVGLFLEVRDDLPIGDVPQRPGSWP